MFFRIEICSAFLRINFFHHATKRIYLIKNSILLQCRYSSSLVIITLIMTFPGIQYWGCCQKKHTDFEKMRNQPGCTYGRHKWSKGLKRAKCRYDHFDNPKLLTLNIYAKNADPASCTFEANGCRLTVNIVYGPERLCYAKEFSLFSSIEPS